MYTVNTLQFFKIKVIVYIVLSFIFNGIVVFKNNILYKKCSVKAFKGYASLPHSVNSLLMLLSTCLSDFSGEKYLISNLEGLVFQYHMCRQYSHV